MPTPQPTRTPCTIWALALGSLLASCAFESRPLWEPIPRAGDSASSATTQEAGANASAETEAAGMPGSVMLIPSSNAGVTSNASAAAGIAAANGGGPAARAGASAGPVAGGAGGSAGMAGAASKPHAASGRGFPETGPWVCWYGPAGNAATLAKAAASFRVISIDADPDHGNFTDAQLQSLRAGGENRVLSYLNVGSCEYERSYFAKAPTGFESCKSSGALTTVYEGHPDEMWADLSNPDYQNLIVNYVAARLAAREVDGFYLDNLDVVEHAADSKNGPCNKACAQAGLDLVWKLRQRFPDKLLVMQNASSDVTRLGKTHGVAFPSLLDGLSHERVYGEDEDSTALHQMQAWRDMHLTVNARPFWLAVEEYVGACSSGDKPAAEAIRSRAAADGFSAYVSGADADQSVPCFW